jgi:Zn-dependent protease
MNGSIACGRVCGIPLRLHWTTPLLVVYLGWIVAAQALPAWAPGHSTETYELAGTGGALLLCAALLAHELAHALTARRAGLTVQDITLWALGGETRTGPARRPRTLFAVSVSGPLASLLIGGLSLAAAAGLGDGHSRNLASAVLALLGWANLLLGAFNLLPATPLDGGHALEALLWRHTRDRDLAARTAAHSGQVIGGLLVALGVLGLTFGALGGVWVAALGVFVALNAVAVRRQVDVEIALRGVTVADVMSTAVDTGPDWWTVDRFLAEVAALHPHAAVPLLDLDGHPAGLAQVERLRLIPPPQRAELRVRDVAQPLARCATARPDEPLNDILARGPIPGGALLAIDGPQLVGIVTGHDIARVLRRHALVVVRAA